MSGRKKAGKKRWSASTTTRSSWEACLLSSRSCASGSASPQFGARSTFPCPCELQRRRIDYRAEGCHSGGGRRIRRAHPESGHVSVRSKDGGRIFTYRRTRRKRRDSFKVYRGGREDSGRPPTEGLINLSWNSALVARQNAHVTEDPGAGYPPKTETPPKDRSAVYPFAPTVSNPKMRFSQRPRPEVRGSRAQENLM